jgi:soluble lytic murein transglycosylase-like protein
MIGGALARNFVLIATLLIASLPREARAGGIYRYVEPDGTVVYTNVPPSGDVKNVRRMKGRSFQRAPHASDAPAPRSRITLKEFDGYIEAAARRYRIPQGLVWAVMHAESNFNPGAVSVKGASGLMQLMPGTATEMYVKDLFDVRENIEGGTRYLRVLANMFDGDMIKMVAAYNAGPDAVKKYNGQVPPYPETQAYVQKVVKLYFRYKQQLKMAQTESR